MYLIKKIMTEWNWKQKGKNVEIERKGQLSPWLLHKCTSLFVFLGRIWDDAIFMQFLCAFFTCVLLAQGQTEKRMNADLRSRILFLSQWILVCKKQKNLHMNSPTNQHISFIRFLQLFFLKKMLRCDYQVNSNIRDKAFIPDSSLVSSCH